MGLGASGCGYEYEDPKYKCEFLSGNLFGFICLKYKVDLISHQRCNHPIRCAECCIDASKYWEDKRKKEMLAETDMIRSKIYK